MYHISIVVLFTLLPTIKSYETVYLTRHCVRSTPMSVYGGTSEYPSLNNYSASPLPDWGVPTYHCLPRGIDLVTTFGKNLKGMFPTPFRSTSHQPILILQLPKHY